MLISVDIAPAHVAAKRYVLEFVFGEFFDVDLQVHPFLNEPVYVIQFPNGKRLRIKDHFFSKAPARLADLREGDIPQRVDESSFPVSDAKLPVLFGQDKVEENPEEIVVHNDLVASIFFFLTRWEEHVHPARDNHGRFPASASLAFKANLLDRPVVNECLDVFKALIERLGVTLPLKKREFQIKPFHDIDQPHRYPRKLMTLPFVHRLLRDPYDTFDFLIDSARRRGLRSHVCFMAAARSDYDIGYDLQHSRYCREKLRAVARGGLEIGFHPGYYTFDDPKLWRTELSRLNSVLAQLEVPAIRSGRQHYLRFNVPTTWQIWEDNGMEWDSSMGYPEREGFRCGICHDFPVFDFISEKKLKLRELPLIVMEGTFQKYQKGTGFEEIEQKVLQLVTATRRYRGTFTLLTHNTTVSDTVWPGWRKSYERILERSLENVSYAN